MSEFKIERKVQRQGKLGYSYTVVIPKAVANYLELDKDSVVEFSINDNKDVVIKRKVGEWQSIHISSTTNLQELW